MKQFIEVSRQKQVKINSIEINNFELYDMFICLELPLSLTSKRINEGIVSGHYSHSRFDKAF